MNTNITNNYNDKVKMMLGSRCDGNFSDEFVIKSLPSPKVKQFQKSVNICRSYGLEQCPFLFTSKLNNMANGGDTVTCTIK